MNQQIIEIKSADILKQVSRFKKGTCPSGADTLYPRGRRI